MSFDELFFIDSSPAASTSPWTLGYAYKFAEYKGYLDGDSSLSNDEVLWEPEMNQGHPTISPWYPR